MKAANLSANLDDPSFPGVVMPARSIQAQSLATRPTGVAHVIGLPAATMSRSSPGARTRSRDGPAHFWACALDICTPTPDLFVNR